MGVKHNTPLNGVGTGEIFHIAHSTTVLHSQANKLLAIFSPTVTTWTQTLNLEMMRQVPSTVQPTNALQ